VWHLKQDKSLQCFVRNVAIVLSRLMPEKELRSCCTKNKAWFDKSGSWELLCCENITKSYRNFREDIQLKKTSNLKK